MVNKPQLSFGPRAEIPKTHPSHNNNNDNITFWSVP